MRRRLRALGAVVRALPWRVGRRGAFLLFLALLDGVFAFGLLAAPAETRASPGYAYLAGVVPLWAWAALWGAIGAACAVQAFMRVDRIAFALASLLKVLWGMVYLLGWIVDAIPRGYVSAAIFLALAGVVQVISGWRENWEH